MASHPGEGNNGSDTLDARLSAERERVDAVIGDLRDELAAIAESTAAGPDDEHDAEGSTVAYERARVQALLAHAQRSAVQIEAARATAAAIQERAGTDGRDGDAGQAWPCCRRCGRPIPEERLIALPATGVCVTCAGAVAQGSEAPGPPGLTERW